MAKKEFDPTQKVTLRRMNRLVDYLVQTVFVENEEIPDEYDYASIHTYILEHVIFYASMGLSYTQTFEDYAREIGLDLKNTLRNNPQLLGCTGPREEAQ